jgi:predicted RNase H-like nuclease
MNLRRRALIKAGIDVDDLVDHASENAGTEDLLDAAMAVWSADRIQRDVAESIPPRNPGDEFRVGQTIWY